MQTYFDKFLTKSTWWYIYDLCRTFATLRRENIPKYLEAVLKRLVELKTFFAEVCWIPQTSDRPLNMQLFSNKI